MRSVVLGPWTRLPEFVPFPRRLVIGNLIYARQFRSFGLNRFTIIERIRGGIRKRAYWHMDGVIVVGEMDDGRIGSDGNAVGKKRIATFRGDDG